MAEPYAPPVPLADLLRRALPGLPPRLRDVGQFVADHQFDAATRSMRGLAATARVSPASFTRLAQALGYTGWDDLRDALIEARRPDPATPFSDRIRPAPPGVATGPAWVVQGMAEADAAGLAGLAASPVVAAAAALHRAAQVWVAGFRSCHSVAALLAYQLRLFRPGTVRLVGGAGPEDFDLGAFATGDAVVITGFAPYSRASVRTAEAARAAGCVLVALADSAAAPLARGADHLLLFSAGAGPGFFPSLTGAVATAQALAAASFTLGGAEAVRHLRATEARLAAHSQYVPEPESPAP